MFSCIFSHVTNTVITHYILQHGVKLNINKVGSKMVNLFVWTYLLSNEIKNNETDVITIYKVLSTLKYFSVFSICENCKFIKSIVTLNFFAFQFSWLRNNSNIRDIENS